MARFADVVLFNPTAGGTTDWTYSSAVQGYNSPALAGMVNGGTYKYRAESLDLSQWEVGEGVYNSGTGVITRATVLFNSSGTGTATGQSGAGTKISFSTVPQVGVVMLREDAIAVDEANSFTVAQKKQARKNIGANDGVLSVDRNGTNQTGMTASGATKIQFTNVVKDADSWYDGVTNFRYTPQVAGTYLVGLSIGALNGTGGETCQAIIYKNGSAFKVSNYLGTTSAGGWNTEVVAAVPMNGTTDFIEGFAYLPAAVTSLIGTVDRTFMWAYRIGD